MFDVDDADDAIARVEACVRDIRQWMAINKLKLNDGKTVVLLLRSPSQGGVPDITELTIGESNITYSDTARNLGAVFDKHLNMEAHIGSMCRTAFFHLQNIASIRNVLDTDSAKMIVQALVTSRIDYCNSLLFGVPQSVLGRLQAVQNAAARVVTRTGWLDHITPALYELHWLPVEYRINFKILLNTYKALNGLAPQYIRELLVPYAPSRTLRSSQQQLLTVPRCRLRTYGNRSFAWAAPTLWNTLPQTIRSASTLDSFKTSLKTHLFRQAFDQFM